MKFGCPTAQEIEPIAEAKATRDVFANNRGVVNKICELKAGNLARFRDGDIIDISEHYHRETWELIRLVVFNVANAAIAKAS